MTLDDVFAELPLVAILRGLTPDEAEPVGDALVAAGFRCLEVPLNSPDPFASIARLASRFSDNALVGVGTVIDAAAIPQLVAAGGRIMIAPNTDPAVITAARDAGLAAMPGFQTPSEAFAALAAGADALKFFPAEAGGPPVLKAIRAVLPAAVRLVPVGGIDAAAMPGFVAAGASGFGIGSTLYAPGRPAVEVGERAAALVAAWRRATR